MAGLCWALLAVAGDSLVAKMAFRSYRSQSMGMYSSVRGTATLVGSLLGGLVAQFLGYVPLFLLSSFFIVIAIAILSFTNVDEGSDEAAQPSHGSA
jgi:MFS family permease